MSLIECQTDLENVSKNYKAMNILCCAFDPNEFDQVSACDTAQEMFDKLVMTYEGSSQVKEIKLNILLR